MRDAIESHDRIKISNNHLRADPQRIKISDKTKEGSGIYKAL